MAEINLKDVLIPEMTLLDIETFKDKEDLFDQMSKKFEEHGFVTSAEDFKASLYRREDEGPTYMGNMIAIPHGIGDEVKQSGVGFCRVKKPFVYSSHGEEGEVKFIFVLAVEKGAVGNEHLQVLAAIAMLLAHEEFREALETVNSFDDLLKAIDEVEFA